MLSRLDPIFNPRSVAVIGASRHPGKIGYEIVHNLVATDFRGVIFPVNPNADSVHGIKAYPSILEVPDLVDLAIITVPADLTFQILEDCGRKGVKGAVVITAGFREIGPVGEAREERLLEICKRHNITMVGPNCMGVFNTNPDVQMNATFAPHPPLRGNVSFVTQSGALGVAILDHARNINIGFAKFVSLGNKAEVSGNDLLEYWEKDQDTGIILMYIENFGNPANFVKIAKRVMKRKPVIALKSGRTEAGRKASLSHTGALGGSDIAAEAIFEQTGVLRAQSIEELFDYAMAFSLQKIPKGKRVAVVTDAGGPAIMATDMLMSVGMEIAQLGEQTKKAIREFAAKEASVENPIDLIASATPQHYERTLDIVLEDPGVDCALVIYVPPVVRGEEDFAKAIWQSARRHEKTVVCCFLGRSEESPGFVELVSHGIPSYLFPESAARSLAAMHQYKLYRERQDGDFVTFQVEREKAQHLISRALSEGRLRLRETESLELLQLYGIQVGRYMIAASHEEMFQAAAEIGYPVVVKALSPNVIHKTEQKSIALGIKDSRELKDAAALLRKRMESKGFTIDGFLIQEQVQGGKELFMGMKYERKFGPLLAFGVGGVYVEYLKDLAYGLAPLTNSDAERMVRSIKTYPLLEGVRGESPSDVSAVVGNLQRLSQLVTELRGIDEVDINPLIVLEKGKGCKAVDARFILLQY